jgi:gamma-glutamyltranspeptidase
MTLCGPIPGCVDAIALGKAHLPGMGLMIFFRGGKPCPLFGAPGGSMIVSNVL